MNTIPKQKLTILFVILLISKMVVAQKFIVNNSKQNIVYVGLDNPMEFLSNQISCNNISIQVFNGTIKRADCYFILIPDSIGEVRIYLTYKKSKSREGKVYTFRARSPYENRKAYLGTVRNDTMPMASIRAMSGIIVTNFSDYEAQIPIKSFIITIVHKNKGEVVTLQNETNFYSPEVKNALEKLEPNDFISFTNIIFQVSNYKGNAEPFYIVAN